MTRTERRAARRRGRWAEIGAMLWLRLCGWRILARGWRGGRGTGAGEIDIIARRRAVVAFIEVKARRRAEALPDALPPGQRRRLARAAAVWVGRHPQDPATTLRFDVVWVGPGLRLRHLADAWRPDSGLLP